LRPDRDAGALLASIANPDTARRDDQAAGLASRLLSTFVQLGGALGVAALVTVASERMSDLLGSGSQPLAAQVGGLNLAFLLAAGVALAAWLVAMFALQPLSGKDVAAAPPAAAEASS
jgi:hypothetical protein